MLRNFEPALPNVFLKKKQQKRADSEQVMKLQGNSDRFVAVDKETDTTKAQ